MRVAPTSTMARAASATRTRQRSHSWMCVRTAGEAPSSRLQAARASSAVRHEGAACSVDRGMVGWGGWAGVGCYDDLDIERTLHQGKGAVVVTVSAEDRVRAAFAEGQRVWPGVGLTAEAFAAYLARVDANAELLPARAADLFIAAACAQGDDLAIRKFDATYLAPIERYVARLHLRPEQLAELRQQLRLSILLDSEPTVRRYRGSGPLAAWVRVIAVRNALNMARARPGRPAGESMSMPWTA